MTVHAITSAWIISPISILPYKGKEKILKLSQKFYGYDIIVAVIL